jgi:glycosyltransferase involved in cell wall biosynthesis
VKLLLLTDAPPCSNLTAGLVLAQMCRFLPAGSVVCYLVLNPYLKPEPCPDLDWIVTEVIEKPNEVGVDKPSTCGICVLSALAKENVKRWFIIPRLVERAAAFGRKHAVDAVWAVLQGQTLVRMAQPVAEQLNVPLYTQVWDPLSWWLTVYKVDFWNRHVALSTFDRTMRASAACATASWAMADDFCRKYGVRSVPVIASHDAAVSAPAAQTLRNRDELVIGMAGQFYAHEEWFQLITALNCAGWQVAGRTVRLTVLGHKEPIGEIPPGHLDFVGWKPQSEAIRILSQGTDLLYCPYPFTASMEEVSRLSFPSKLPLYFASGRPVLMHGPRYSSPVRYLLETGAGVLCLDLDPPAVYNALQRMVEDRDLYQTTAKKGHDAFLRDFSHARMNKSVSEFLGDLA